MDALKIEKYNGHTIKVYPDSDAENPIKEEETLGEYISWDRRHNFGNKVFQGITQLKTYIQKRKCFVFNWYIYKHSGIAFALSNEHYPFNDVWDSWQLGHIVVPIVQAKKVFGKNVTMEQVKVAIEGELETYERYVNGDIYYVTVEGEDGEIIDSCGGIYDLDEFVEEMKTNIDNKVVFQGK